MRRNCGHYDVNVMRSKCMCNDGVSAGANIPEPRPVVKSVQLNRRISQMRAPLLACLELAGDHNKLIIVLYVFKHKTQHLLIHAPYTHIAVFWYISNIPPRISSSQICYNTPMFCKAAIFVKYCYTTGVGCHNV